MKIAIIGSGAMGSLYGAKLSKNRDNKVYLLDVWREHIDAINAEGLKMHECSHGESRGENALVYRELIATDNPEDIGEVDLAIVFVKSSSTEAAVKFSQAVIGDKTVILTLQNGLGNADIIESAVGAGRVVAGTTSHGANTIRAGEICHAGEGPTVIGELHEGADERLMKIKENFEAAGLQVEIANDVLALIWDKLLVNVGINPITAILGLRNGEIPEYPDADKLMEAAVLEADSIRRAAGISAGSGDPVEHVRSVCRRTAQNRSSMLQDIASNRKTEIDFINGAIVREGMRLGIPTPVNAALVHMIKILEEKESGQ